jgi:hypothetical protein
MRLVKLISTPGKARVAFVNPKYVVSVEPRDDGGCFVTALGPTVIKVFSDHRSACTIVALLSNRE